MRDTGDMSFCSRHIRLVGESAKARPSSFRLVDDEDEDEDEDEEDEEDEEGGGRGGRIGFDTETDYDIGHMFRASLIPEAIFWFTGENGDDEDDEYDPALTLTYIGGEAPGYGSGDQPFGGGRRTRDERLWSHPVKFKIAKYRVHGSTSEPLRIVSITQLFAEGRYGR